MCCDKAGLGRRIRLADPTRATSGCAIRAGATVGNRVLCREIANRDVGNIGQILDLMVPKRFSVEEARQ
jgi:hypothetical protein